MVQLDVMTARAPTLRKGAMGLQAQSRFGVSMLGGGLSTAFQRVDEDRALTLAAYFAAIRAISEDVAKMPIRVYVPMTPRGKDHKPTHRVAQLLNRRPNSEMTAMSLREVLIQHALGWGNGYAELVRNGRNEVVEMYPIHASRIRVGRNKRGELTYYICNDDATETPFASVDIFHVHGLGGDGITGYSVLQYASESLGLGLAAQKFGASFYGNGTKTSGILTHPGTLSPTAQENLRKSWRSAQQNLTNAQGVAILEEGLKYEPISIPPEQAQFLETRKFQVDEVARWFRIPPHKLGALDRATFNNIEHLGISYWQDTLTSWSERFEQEAEAKLLTPAETDLGMQVDHDFTDLLRGDSTSHGEFLSKMFNIGGMSVNDIRDSLGLNGIGPAGDVYLTPVNLAPAGTVPNEQVEPQEPASPDIEDPPGEPESLPVPPVRSLAPESLAKVYESVFEDAARRLLVKESARIKKTLGRRGTADDPVYYESKLPDEMWSTLGPCTQSLVAAVMTAAGGEAVETTGEVEAIAHDYVATWAERHGLESRREIDSKGGELPDWTDRHVQIAKDETQRIAAHVVALMEKRDADDQKTI